MSNKYGRAPVTYIPHWLYVLFASLIFLGEIPLNAMVFQIFAESQVMTWVMAFVVGLSVPIAAHFVGIKFREHPDGFSLANTFKALLAFSIITYALYWLSLIRQTYLGENRELLGLTDNLVESSFMFFWLNLAIFAAAIMVAYLSHDPVPGFQEAQKNVENAKKEVEKREKRRVKRLKSSAERRAHEKDKIEREYREQIDRVNLLRGTYDQLLLQGQEYESRCERLLMEKISIYRHENIRNRDDKMHPIAFDLDLDFTHELNKLGEKLDNEENNA